MSLVLLCHFTSWSRKRHMDKLLATGSCFCLITKTHYRLKQIKVYHVHETTLTVLLRLRQLPVRTHVHLQLRTKQAKQLRSFFENGEMAVTLPTAALPPPFKALGRSTCANQIRSETTTFPAGPHGPFQLCQTCFSTSWRFSLVISNEVPFVRFFLSSM